MIVTKKTIDRRTLLRGFGASVALPLLDSMIPALVAAPNPPKRFGVVYVPNGIMMQNWTPAAVGSAYEFTPILKPLEGLRDDILVLSRLNSIPPPTSTDTHPRASTRFLTDVPPKPTRGTADLQAGTSMDQMLAKEFGRETQLASLELGLESSESAGTCSAGFSCAYTSTISWRTPTTPLPMEHDPRAAFERMFGDNSTTDPAARLARVQETASILDSVLRKADDLGRALGASDRAKLNEYLEAIRDVERRIQKAEKENSQKLAVVDRPAGIPEKFEDHARLMYDLFALAYQADLTRVVTFMIGREQSGQTFPEFGIPDAHHAISHHGNDTEKLAKLVVVNRYHISLFAQFLEKLRSTPDGDGSLLDHSVIIYGAGMSDGNAHDPLNLPVLLAGTAGGAIKSGRHIRFGNDERLANLHLTLLHRFGLGIEKIGDSTRMLSEL